MRKIKGLRWFIIVMIFCITVVNYIDRMTLSILAPTIRDEFGLSNVDYSRIVFMFLLAYTISQSVMGKFLDKVGTRLGFMFFVGIWSIASMLHATARNGLHLGIFRFLLGTGEGGNWPGAAKAVAEWFPIRERAFAMAIFNSGASIGAVVAPPVIAWVALTYNWRASFFVGAGLSALLIILWFFFFHTPQNHPRLSEAERTHILSDRSASAAEQARRKWLALFKYRPVWGLVVARIITDPIWWFYISWLPNYLKNERQFSLALIGLLAWIPFLFADLGNLIGGAISSRLIKRGWEVDKARKLVMYTSALLIPAGMVAVFTRSHAVALAGISLSVFAFQSWIVNLITLPSDCFPKQDVGSVAGIGGTAAGIGSMLFTLLVGYLVDHFSYTPVFVIVSLLGPLGAAMLSIIVKKIERVT